MLKFRQKVYLLMHICIHLSTHAIFLFPLFEFFTDVKSMRFQISNDVYCWKMKLKITYNLHACSIPNTLKVSIFKDFYKTTLNSLISHYHSPSAIWNRYSRFARYHWKIYNLWLMKVQQLIKKPYKWKPCLHRRISICSLGSELSKQNKSN